MGEHVSELTGNDYGAQIAALEAQGEPEQDISSDNAWVDDGEYDPAEAGAQASDHEVMAYQHDLDGLLPEA